MFLSEFCIAIDNYVLKYGHLQCENRLKHVLINLRIELSLIQWLRLKVGLKNKANMPNSTPLNRSRPCSINLDVSSFNLRAPDRRSID